MLRKNDQNMFNASNAIKNERFSFENKYANMTNFLFFSFIVWRTKLFSFGIKIKKKNKTKQKSKNKAINLYALFEKCILTNMIVEYRVMCRPISAFYTDTEMARWKIDKCFRFYVCDSPDNVFTLSKTRMHSSLFDETTQALFEGITIKTRSLILHYK